MQELNREQKINLLKLARETIGCYLNGEKLPDSDLKKYSDEIFKEKCGAFVTLHISSGLRGCIGYIQGVKTIPETVIDMSKASAFQDPRFPSLSKGEFEKIDIEISILSPIEELKDISEIVVGRDGLIISDGLRSGLLLPQVATEQNWDVNQFLQNTCFKAGLQGDAWKMKGTKIEKFSAQVFGEREMGMLE